VLPATAWPEKTGTVTNTDRLVQIGRKAVDSPGRARADLWIIAEIGRRMGLDWRYPIDPCGGEGGVSEVYEEMRTLMPSIRGITWKRMQGEGAVTYPCVTEHDPGQRVVFTECFPTTDGRGRFVPSALGFAAEQPDADYPLVLITGRQLEHWHTGSMSRRAGALDALEPGATVSMHPERMQQLGIAAGEMVCVSSRRGEIVLPARADEGIGPDFVFVPFAYAEAAGNLLTHAALDPTAKIAEVKYCAVRVGRVP
jgi:formate dehydrogenase major subunit